jgi:hypothetical protein
MQFYKKYTLIICATVFNIVNAMEVSSQSSSAHAANNSSPAQPVITQSGNLLSNADFMAKDPQQRPLRWIMGKGLQTAILTGEQRHGTNKDDRSLKVADSSASNEVLVRSEKKIANPGTKYTASAWVKTSAGTPGGLSIEFWDQNEKRVGVKSIIAAVDSVWQQLSVALVAPDKTTHISVAISTEKKDTGISYWDDMSLLYEFDYYPEMVTGVRELFIDDYRVESVIDIQRMVHPGTKSKPLIKPTEPWEGNAVYIYGTVLKNEPAGSGYRMWYTSYQQEKYYLCYATSKDGITWKKPKLGIFDYKGSKENNICKLGGGTLVYDAAEKDPRRRYKMMDVVQADTAKKKTFGYGVFFSENGLNWIPFDGNPVISYADVSTVAYDEPKGLFIAATKQRMLVSNTSVTPGKMDRAAFISTSKDFINWTAPSSPGSAWTLAVEGDQVDDMIVMSKGGMEGQIYGMTVHPYEGIYIGLPWAFDVSSYTAGVFAGYGDGPIQPQIAASRDLRHWNRPSREPVLPLGKAGAWDDGTLYSSSKMLVSEKQIDLYFGAMNMTHGGSSNTQIQTAQIAKATWRRDGFVSMANAGDDEGIITTNPVVFTGNRLVVNAKLFKAGSLKIEILDDSNIPVPGFTIAEAKPITGDQLSAVVSWQQGADLKRLAGKRIKLRFHLKGGDLYSYWFMK